jgi:hypothetical protein
LVRIAVAVWVAAARGARAASAVGVMVMAVTAVYARERLWIDAIGLKRALNGRVNGTEHVLRSAVCGELIDGIGDGRFDLISQIG